MDRQQIPLPASRRAEGDARFISIGIGRSSGRGEDQRTMVSGGDPSSHQPVNLLKLQAICLVLNAFLPSIKMRLAQVLNDNTTDMRYCIKQDGFGSWGLCSAKRHLKDHEW